MMKISIAISILILAVAAIMGWNNHQQLQVITESHRSLIHEAAALGLKVDVKNPQRASFVTKRARKEKDAQARLLAKELIVLALELDASLGNGADRNQPTPKKILEEMGKMDFLDAGQLKILIEELYSNTEMKEKIRDKMINRAMRALIDQDPKAALILCSERGLGGPGYLNESLVKWADSDLEGALEWIRKNGEKYPDDLDAKRVKLELVRRVASNGAAQGFELIGKLELENPNDAINELASSIKSPAERTEFLKLYREYLKHAPDEEMNNYNIAMECLARGSIEDGFAEGSRWLEENELSQDQKINFCNDIRIYAKSSEKGSWIEWMGENIPAKDRGYHIEDVMSEWTSEDSLAAGEWLAQAPDSDAKKASVATYAVTVAPHDPKVAAEWALTLPPGQLRKETLNSVYERWLKNKAANQAERDAFMSDHPAE